MRIIRTCGGFTFLEALLSVFFLGLLAAGATAIHFSGMRSLDEQANRILLDGQIRSRMEVLIATDFDSLNNGSEVVTVRGTDYTIPWTVALVDLDGDTNPEPTAKQVTVSVDEITGRSLTTIVADNEGQLNRI